MTRPTVSDLFAHLDSRLAITLFRDLENGDWLSYVSAHQIVAEAQVCQEGDDPQTALAHLLRAPATAESGVGT